MSASDDYGEIEDDYEKTNKPPPDMDDIVDRASGVIFAHELQSKSTSPSMKYLKDSSVFFPYYLLKSNLRQETMNPSVRSFYINQ